jgi:hypothetical protein
MILARSNVALHFLGVLGKKGLGLGHIEMSSSVPLALDMRIGYLVPFLEQETMKVELSGSNGFLESCLSLSPLKHSNELLPLFIAWQ